MSGRDLEWLAETSCSDELGATSLKSRATLSAIAVCGRRLELSLLLLYLYRWHRNHTPGIRQPAQRVTPTIIEEGRH